jgi:hypothetical protein
MSTLIHILNKDLKSNFSDLLPYLINSKGTPFIVDILILTNAIDCFHEFIKVYDYVITQKDMLKIILNDSYNFYNYIDRSMYYKLIEYNAYMTTCELIHVNKIKYILFNKSSTSSIKKNETYNILIINKVQLELI